MFVRPWSKEAENILRQLSMNGRAYTCDMKLTRNFSKRREIRMLADMDFLDITNNRRKQRSWFVTPPDVAVMPKFDNKGIRFDFKKFKIL